MTVATVSAAVAKTVAVSESAVSETSVAETVAVAVEAVALARGGVGSVDAVLGLSLGNRDGSAVAVSETEAAVSETVESESAVSESVSVVGASGVGFVDGGNLTVGVLLDGDRDVLAVVAEVTEVSEVTVVATVPGLSLHGGADSSN